MRCSSMYSFCGCDRGRKPRGQRVSPPEERLGRAQRRWNTRQGRGQAASRRRPQRGAAGPARLPSPLPPFLRPFPIPSCPTAPTPTMSAAPRRLPALRRALRPAASPAAKRQGVTRNGPGWKRCPTALWFLLVERRPSTSPEGYAPGLAGSGRGKRRRGRRRRGAFFRLGL